MELFRGGYRSVRGQLWNSSLLPRSKELLVLPFGKRKKEEAAVYVCACKVHEIVSIGLEGKKKSSHKSRTGSAEMRNPAAEQ